MSDASSQTPATGPVAGTAVTDSGARRPDPDRVLIFDTTLRDGEQSPGATMTRDEKLRIAEVLDEMGVDIIEAGFPIASEGDFESVKAVAKQVQNATVAGLARAAQKDIQRAADAVIHAKKPRIHTFLATSPLHRQFKLNMDQSQVLEKIHDSVTLARSLVEDVEWSAEDGSRTEPEFLARCVEVAIAAGATTINIPDTVGYAVPEEYGAYMRRLIETVPNSHKAIFSVHCHNDLGLAVANSLAGVRAGARQIECTINGIGERAGNTALEEVVMAMRTRSDFFPIQSTLDATHIARASRLVSTSTGFTVQPNKAIVGKNAFAHESGIHQDGMLKNRETYEIMTPESVGIHRSTLVLGKHSGRAAFRARLKELGYDLGDNQLQDAFDRFKALADRKKEVFDEDLVALVDDQVGRANDHIQLKSLSLVAGTVGPQVATLSLTIDGEVVSTEATGNGPVDAIFRGIRALVPHEATLDLFQISAVTQGTDAQAEVTVRLEEEGRLVTGQGVEADTMVAAARAYIHALNKLQVRRTRSAPEALSA